MHVPHTQHKLIIIIMCTCSQYLRQFAEVPSVDVPTDALIGLAHILTDKSEGVGHSQQREQLVLLRLVVKDLGLRLSV